MSHDLTQDRAELERLTETIHQARSEAGRNLWVIGESLRRIREDALWESGSYSTFTDYLERGALVSRSFGYKLIKIAEQFNRPIAEQYGINKLQAVVKYIEVSPTDEQPGDVLAADIQIRDEQGRFVTVPLHDATTTQIEEATSLMKERLASAKRPDDRYVEAAARIAERLPKVKGVSAKQRVKVRKSADGEVFVSFRDVGVGDLGEFVRVVLEEMGDEA